MFIDVGANVGTYSLAARRVVGRSGTVLALEANPVVFRELVTSVRSAGVTCLNLAASNQSGWATLSVPTDANGIAETQLASLEARNSAGENLTMLTRTTRIDDLVPWGASVSVIKIDVEGHELAVLEGATETLNTSRPALVVEIEARHLVGVLLEEVVGWVRARGYDAFGIASVGLIPWARYDVFEHQTRWLASQDGLTTIQRPAEYVNNFLFLARDT